MKKRALCALLVVLLCVSLLPVSALAAEDTVAINETNFPDPNFRSWLQSEYGDSAVISQVTRIDVFNKSISDLKGIEYFSVLTFLDCDNNQLTSLDVSKNTWLTRLYCFANQLTSLDISRNPYLLEAYIKGEKGEYSNYTRYLVSGKYLYVDPDVKIVCLSVTAQPKSQTVAAGKTATFSVEASGQDLTYQWYVQKKGSTAWNKVSGGTSAKLTVKTAASMDGNKYRCQVTGAGRDETVTVTSQAAKLTVIAKPKITTQPKGVTVKEGKTAVFKVKATGSKLKYQWYCRKTGSTSWCKVKNGTKPTLKITAKLKMNGYAYRCKVYNSIGKVYSKTVKLKVKK